MKIDNFKFETDSLGCYSIEDGICRGCGLYEPESSDLGLYAVEGKHQNVNIFSKNGSVSCRILACKGKEKKYTVSVSAIDVKKHK